MGWFTLIPELRCPTQFELNSCHSHSKWKWDFLSCWNCRGEFT